LSYIPYKRKTKILFNDVFVLHGWKTVGQKVFDPRLLDRFCSKVTLILIVPIQFRIFFHIKQAGHTFGYDVRLIAEPFPIV